MFGDATMTAAAQRAMMAREWGLLALLSLLWGGSFFFVGVAVREIPPLTLVALRVGLAVLGFGNNALPFALIAWGQTQLTSGLASILNAATPLFTVLAAHVLTAEER